MFYVFLNHASNFIADKFPVDTVYKLHTFFRCKEYQYNYSATLTLQTGN